MVSLKPFLGFGRKQRRSAEVIGRAIAPVVEGLEARRLLSVSCGLSGGLLTVTSDGQGDDVLVSTTSGTLSVTDVNAQSTACSYAESAITAGIVINGGGGDDYLRVDDGGSAVSSSIPVTMNGSDGVDTLDGGNGNDVLNGGADVDSLFGDAGNDTLIGGAGDDQMDGGTGGDAADYSASSAHLTINLSTGSASGEGNDTLNTIENANGGSGHDNITGTDVDANILKGGAGNDTLSGGANDDRLEGGTGTDLIYGGADHDDIDDGDHSDTVYGGGGNDTIRGDAGDYWYGEDGDDVFWGFDGYEDYIDGGSGNHDSLPTKDTGNVTDVYAFIEHT